ncbi:MAG: aspartate aminotransferase family protein [Candidatus Gastranaerophilales bacterium]|nr:aspartate aminotransferase family protein [Candidatus Gastranaerophilales bacterium]
MTDTKDLTNKYIMGTYNRFDTEIENGNGVYIIDGKGKKYLDFTAGIAVNTLGYIDRDCIKAITEQIEKYNHCSNLYYSRPQAEVAEILVENSCFEKVFFCNSGAEANETMIKIARKFGKTKGENCSKIITMKNSFHGRTTGAITATGQEKYQKSFTPLLPDFAYAEFNNLQSVEALADEHTCAIIVEPVQGEGGLHVAKKEFLQGLRKLCDEKNILLGFDEVQCGIGRTGTLFAYQSYGVEPDMAAMAKGLANGLPIGACAAKGIASTILVAGDHASTFGGNPVSCASAKVVLNKLIKGNLLENVKTTGEYLISELKKLAQKYPVIKDVRGLGLMVGAELSVPAKDIIKKCMDKGLMIIGAGTHVMRFVPPMIITKDHVDEAIKIIDEVLGETNE